MIDALLVSDLLDDWSDAYTRYCLWSRRSDGESRPVYVNSREAESETVRAERDMELVVDELKALGITRVGFLRGDVTRFEYRGTVYEHEHGFFKPELEDAE